MDNCGHAMAMQRSMVNYGKTVIIRGNAAANHDNVMEMPWKTVVTNGDTTSNGSHAVVTRGHPWSSMATPTGYHCHP